MKASDEELIEDVGLIKQGLQEKINEISDKENIDVQDIVSKAFALGISYYAVSEESIPRIDPEKLEDDVFSYKKWQLDIYEDISTQYPGIQWAEVKSAFLEKGLEKISQN